MSGHTPGPWQVSRDMKQGRDGKKYGLEVCGNVPADCREPWESAGYIPLCDVFHPANPHRAADYQDPAVKAAILARHEANARLIAAAPTAPHECERPGCPGGRLHRFLVTLDAMPNDIGDEAREILAAIRKATEPAP